MSVNVRLHLSYAGFRFPSRLVARVGLEFHPFALEG